MRRRCAPALFAFLGGGCGASVEGEAGAWSEPLGPDTLPGAGDVQALDGFIAAP